MARRQLQLPPLTLKQRRVYDFIAAQYQGGVSPTYSEIAAHMGVTSTATINQYVKALIEKGWIRRYDDGRRRARQLIPTE